MSTPAVSAPHRRFDRYTMWTLYAALPMAPLLSAMLLVGTPERTWATLPHLAALSVAAGLCVPVLRATMQRAHRGTPWPRTLLSCFLLAVAVAAGFGALAVPTGTADGVDLPSLLVLISLALVCIAVAPPLTWRQAGWVSLAVGGLTALSWILLHGGFGSEDFAAGRWFPALFTATLCAFVISWSTTLTVWMQRQMLEQAELTEVRSELAVAEERLRFSRDLHDIFGRTLTAVTVKSDLAAELSDLGRAEQASEQMREVHRLAEDALREVRAVVGGYRSIDLAAELRGARALLLAAGIRARVIGDGTGLPEPVGVALAWVVREAATNVVHHSRATQASIALNPGTDVVTLTVSNDGVLAAGEAPEVPGGRTGSGLAGLTDRLAPLGGTLATTTERGQFMLTARIPLETP